MERSRDRRYSDEERRYSDRQEPRKSRDYERDRRDHRSDYKDSRSKVKEPHRYRRDQSRSPRRDYESDSDHEPDERRKRSTRSKYSSSPSTRRPSSPGNRHSTRYKERDGYRKNRRDNDESYKWGKSDTDNKRDNKEQEEPAEKEKPNFGLSGALTEDTNKVNGVVVKYSEPPEARKPKRRWRLYPFKGEQALPVLHIHRQSCFLVGRDRKVVDLAVDHPSCSKQHAALQYRLVNFERDDGSTGKRVRLYLIDLESANGTFLNNKKIEARKYYELFEKDVIKFGFSTREYVLLHENSREDQEDDDVKQEPEDEPEGINV